MENTAYDLLDLAGVQRWQAANQGDNSRRLERLAHYLPIALSEELTPRQNQMVRLYYYERKSVTAIARELSVNKSTVTRTLQRARTRLRKSLRYAL